jgi:hypothetical protein
VGQSEKYWDCSLHLGFSSFLLPVPPALDWGAGDVLPRVPFDFAGGRPAYGGQVLRAKARCGFLAISKFMGIN